MSGGATTGFAEWTEVEEKILRDLWPAASWVALRVAFAGRTDRAIKNRAIKLGIRREKRSMTPEGLEARRAEMKRPGRKVGRKPVSPVSVRDGVAGKDCVKCLEWKPLEKFALHSSCAGGRRNICTLCGGRIHGARYYDANREKCIAKTRAYQKAHPEQVRALKQASEKIRHGRKLEGKGVTVSGILFLMEVYGGFCAYCEATPADTIDHVMPLARGGKHELSNLLPACRSCNSSKNKKTLEEWQETKRRRG